MSEASSMESSMMSPDPSTLSSRTPVDIGAGYSQVDTDRLASKIIGSPVYDGTAADANNLGKINDLVLNQNGQVAAVVLGVGGFLGIAEKQVAVDFSALQWVVAADNTERFVLQTTKDQLTNAPDFKTVDDQPSGASSAPADTSSSAMTAPASSSSAAM
jgi:sporulation protein YlmC with PRC-barrel domain